MPPNWVGIFAGGLVCAEFIALAAWYWENEKTISKFHQYFIDRCVSTGASECFNYVTVATTVTSATLCLWLLAGLPTLIFGLVTLCYHRHSPERRDMYGMFKLMGGLWVLATLAAVVVAIVFCATDYFVPEPSGGLPLAPLIASSPLT